MTGIQTESIDKKTTKVDIAHIGAMSFNDATELTISNGIVVATQSHHTIDTEADAATDDLVTINGGTDGQVLVIRTWHQDRTVVVKDSTGNILLAGDFSMDSTHDTLMLMYAGSYWRELSRTNSGA